MTDPALPATQPSFEALKRLTDHDAEYWSARDLQPLLGYSQWQRFEEAVGRAQIACEQSANEAGHHFAGAGKMIETGKGAQREVDDYHLSRFACYLIAQNGDPRKPAIARAQEFRRPNRSGPWRSVSSCRSNRAMPSDCWAIPRSRRLTFEPSLRAFAPSCESNHPGAPEEDFTRRHEGTNRPTEQKSFSYSIILGSSPSI